MSPRVVSRKPASIAAAGLAALLALASPARSAERVTLANGFSMECHHHAEIEGRIRLYTDRTENNFVEVAPESVVAVDSLPAPLPVDPSAPARNWIEVTPRPEAATGAAAQIKPEELHQLLSEAGQNHNLDADLLASVVKAESGGKPRAVSRAGARGLMQLMPQTARQLGVDNSFEPRQNVQGGSAYLDGLLLRYHDNLPLALAAYNAGPAVVDRCHCVPNNGETPGYVSRVIHEFNRRVAARRAEVRRASAAR